ncbi:DUF6924 domain-containing protein [Streptomyces sp. SR-10]|uniref:DUF6924 domain-containing protein n=1 Tax=Streptomyces sp. SR-10 TaxID=3416442 RepID=UPI003CEF81C2
MAEGRSGRIGQRRCQWCVAAWREVIAELERVAGGREWESPVHLVDDRRWDGVTSEEALVAAARDEELGVVFLADGVTMRSPLRPLLALDLGADDDQNCETALSDPCRAEEGVQGVPGPWRIWR